MKGFITRFILQFIALFVLNQKAYKNQPNAAVELYTAVSLIRTGGVFHCLCDMCFLEHNSGETKNFFLKLSDFS